MFRLDIIGRRTDIDNPPEQQDSDPDTEVDTTDERAEAFTPPSAADIFARKSLAAILEATKNALPGEKRDVYLPTPIITQDATELRTDISALEGGPYPLVDGLVGRKATVLCVKRQHQSLADNPGSEALSVAD